MEYLDHKEFAGLLGIAQSTFNDKIAKKAIPVHCKTVQNRFGIKGKLWSESKVQKFMDWLIPAAQRLQDIGHFEKNSSALGFSRATLRAVLRIKETPATNKASNYDLFIQTSAQLTNNRGI